MQSSKFSSPNDRTSFSSILSMPKRVVSSTAFQNFIVGVILFAAVLVGLETSKTVSNEYGEWLKFLDRIVLIIFTGEVLLKIAAEGRRPWRFFLNGWNLFDFLIVGVCFLPLQAQFVAVLRLVRILRVLRLVSVLPRLQLLVGALLKSMPSIGYVALLLSIHFYIYAVLGVFLWGENDPMRFGSLPLTFLTLFQCVTMEGWVDIMHTQMWGCSQFVQSGMEASCTASRGMPIIAPIYFISFIILGTMIILNLFIGVMMNSLQEMQEERTKHLREAMDLQATSTQKELSDLIKQTSAISERLSSLKARLTL
ncbi:MAG: ion transporter [Proteobacteria bacterium]|nr:ion transporter [Pseudomonadota bacterium]